MILWRKYFIITTGYDKIINNKDFFICMSEQLYEAQTIVINQRQRISQTNQKNCVLQYSHLNASFKRTIWKNVSEYSGIGEETGFVNFMGNKCLSFLFLTNTMTNGKFSENPIQTRCVRNTIVWWPTEKKTANKPRIERFSKNFYWIWF